MKSASLAITISLCAALIAGPASAQQKKEIRAPEETIAYFKSLGYWGIEKRSKTLVTPRVYTMKTAKSFDPIIKKFPVSVKKELFYRSALPLMLAINEEILADRQRLVKLRDGVKKGSALPARERAWVEHIAKSYKVKVTGAGLSSADSPAWREMILRVDAVSPSLALGQAAYESAYGASRFALHGNAFFGIWTWGDKGMVPKEQRKSLGDYKVAAYDTPIESVRAYARTLNTNSTYADLRAKRAELRRDGKPLSGVVLAGGLLKYSERGEYYVKTLRGIIKHNELEIADDAVLKDMPVVHLIEIE